jgi:hypothetical protein
MSAEVVTLSCVTKQELTPERVLQAAIVANLKHAIIIGVTQDNQRYVALTHSDAANALWHIEKARQDILTVDIDQE